jgi:hypothetical protein
MAMDRRMPEKPKTLTYQPNEADQVTGAALLGSRLDEFSDLPEVPPGNRPLIVVLTIAVVLTIGHFAYHSQIAPADAGVPQQQGSTHV